MKKLFTIISCSLIGIFSSYSQRILINPYGNFDTEIKKITNLSVNSSDRLIVGGAKGEVLLYDLSERQIIGRQSLKKEIVYSSHLGQDEKILVVDATGTIRIYDKDLSNQLYELSSEGAVKATVDPNKHYLAVYNKSSRIEIFDLTAQMVLGRIDATKKFREIQYIGFDRFSQQLTAIDKYGDVYNWDPYTQQLNRNLKLSSDEFHGSKSNILSASSNFGSDAFIAGIQEFFLEKGGQNLARKNMAIAYNWYDGKELKRVKINRRPDQVVLGPGPNHFTYITSDNNLKQISLFSIARGELDSRVSLDERADFITIAESNDWLAAALSDGSVALYTLDKNQTAQISILKPSLSRSVAEQVVKQEVVNIAGVIENNNNILNVNINGTKAQYDATGNFSSTVSLLPGKNRVRVVAKDTEDKEYVKDLYITRELEVPKSESADAATASSNLKKIALIIGNSDYNHTAKLKNPENDAAGMASLLREYGFDVLELENGTYEQMKNIVYKFAARTSNSDVSIFYYAGHGIEIDRSNYLIPVDAQLSSALDVKMRSIPLSTILNVMEYTNKEGLNMMILDACRNNPFPTGKRGGAGLSKVTPPSGTLIAYATDPGSTASDGEGENGLYTGELLKQMKISQRIVDVFRNTRVNVEQLSNGQQRPWEEARLKGIFYLH